MADSTTPTVVRTRSTVCSSEMTRASSRGAAPNTSAVSAGAAPGVVYQSMKAVMPACATSETHERSSAPSSRNHGRVSSMRFVAAVVSSPVARMSSTTSGTAVAAPPSRRVMPTRLPTAYVTIAAPAPHSSWRMAENTTPRPERRPTMPPTTSIEVTASTTAMTSGMVVDAPSPMKNR